MNLRIVTPNDDLARICAQIQPDKWAADNEMTSYKEESLRRYLQNDDNLLFLAEDGDKIAGVALCYILPHPDGNDTLYVHEFDSHPDYRRQGVGTFLMGEVIKVAKDRGIKETWVGADFDNPTANAFYKKLGPKDIDPAVIYTYTSA